ncbi:MAG TPA: hypothetical protein VM388_09575 [Acidimicrobiales bacterium]|nr:hypothetical protein [Acidimicrobiales bacterium]
MIAMVALGGAGAANAAGQQAGDRAASVAEPVVSPETDGGPIEVGVSIYLMSLGKPDLSAGTYTADFYLIMSCEVECDPSGFELRNGKITSVDAQDESPTRRVFRVNANLTAPLVLSRYPFDRHTLSIEIEDRLRPLSQLVYVPKDKNGIDPHVQVPGWELHTDSVRTSTGVHNYPVFDPPDDDYSLYKYDIEIGRARLASFMKVVLPALAIMATAMLGLMLKPDKALSRMGIHTGALTAAILLHLNITAGIPPTGYLVDADKFMVANYAGVVAAVLSTVYIMMRYDKGADDRATRAYRISFFAVPATWLLGQLIVWVL